MLYKKYHRNFVSRFKKGTRLELKKDGDYIQTTTISPPFVRRTFATRKPFIVVNYIADKTVDRRILVFSSGRVNDYKYL